MAIDETKLMAFMGQAVTDMSASVSVALMAIGDKLGLYKAMAGSGPMTSAEVAERTGTHERYVREWLNNQVAGGYITYEPAGRTYELEAEQALPWRMKTARCFSAGRSTSWGRAGPPKSRSPRPSDRAKGWMARTSLSAFRWHRALLPARLSLQPGFFMDSSPGRRRAQTAERSPGRRYWLRSRGVDRDYGHGLPEFHFPRL